MTHAAELEAPPPSEPLLPATRPSLYDRFSDRICSPTRARCACTRWLGPTLVVLLAAVLRLWSLGNAHDLMNQFDETYYVKDAWTLSRLGYEGRGLADGGRERPVPLRRRELASRPIPSFVVHPPLGKWIIALGMMAITADERLGLAHHDRAPRDGGRARADADREADDALDHLRRDRRSAHGDRRTRDLDEPRRAARHPAARSSCSSRSCSSSTTENAP